MREYRTGSIPVSGTSGKLPPPIIGWRHQKSELHHTMVGFGFVFIHCTSKKALKALCFQGFFCVNGALLLERYSLWCPVLWWPELLKSYKKQRVAIKRYFRYCSTSLLFFLGFSVFPFALRLSQKPFFVGARLCVVGFKDVLFSFKPHVNVS